MCALKTKLGKYWCSLTNLAHSNVINVGVDCETFVPVHCSVPISPLNCYAGFDRELHIYIVCTREESDEMFRDPWFRVQS